MIFCWFNVQCSDLHNQIQVINKGHFLSFHSKVVQQTSCTNSYSTEMKKDAYHLLAITITSSHVVAVRVN